MRRARHPASDSVGLRVQPRASKTEVVGRHGDVIKIGVKAPPVDGEANEELLRFVAKRCRVARSAVRLLSGARSRHKRLTIKGLTAAQVVQALLNP